uniref:Histone deacetylase HDT1-like n=1 Tax=Steinernema glaseri TaxID=37863 RepID=A0A1I7Y1G4_9BILA
MMFLYLFPGQQKLHNEETLVEHDAESKPENVTVVMFHAHQQDEEKLDEGEDIQFPDDQNEESRADLLSLKPKDRKNIDKKLAALACGRRILGRHRHVVTSYTYADLYDEKLDDRTQKRKTEKRETPAKKKVQFADGDDEEEEEEMDDEDMLDVEDKKEEQGSPAILEPLPNWRSS